MNMTYVYLLGAACFALGICWGVLFEKVYWLLYWKKIKHTFKCTCMDCIHNRGTWCDFESHCKKKFMEPDKETDTRLNKAEGAADNLCVNDEQFIKYCEENGLLNNTQNSGT